MPTTDFAQLDAYALHSLLVIDARVPVLVYPTSVGPLGVLPSYAERTLPTGLRDRAIELALGLGCVCQEFSATYTDPVLAGNLVAIISEPEVRA